jgi:hypothetical protein
MKRVALKVALGFAIIAFVVQGSASSVTASVSKGWVEQGCSEAIFHITNYDHSSKGQELVFQMGTGGNSIWAWILYGAGPGYAFFASGQRCPRVGNCEEGTHSNLWFNQKNKGTRHIWGRYAVDFGAQHLEGEFVVKYRLMKPLPRCE